MDITSTINNLDNNTNQVNFDRARQNLGSDKLDKTAFMQLLMAKLKNQDPMNPVNDSDFLNQQAQLAQVEKLDDLNTTMQGTALLSQASSLVGKKVDVTDSNGQTVTGVINSAAFSNGTAGLDIGGQSYSLSQVSKVYGSI